MAPGALALSVMLLPTASLAQYVHAPFIEQTVPQSQALGFETIGDKLLLATTFSPPLDRDLVEQLKDMPRSDVARFVGTLQVKDKKLAASLLRALDAVANKAGDGKDVSGPVRAAQPLLAKAYETVLGQKLRDDPSFKAGLMANLLLADNGVSEGDYVDAWAGLQRVKQLWAELKPLASAQRQADAQSVLDELDKLFPTAEPPKSMTGRTDDDAEDPAQRLSSIVEDVVSSDLYPDRDLPRLTAHLVDVTATACTAYGKHRDKIAAESLYAAFDHYSSHISETASLVEPELQKKVSALFGKLINAKDRDDDGKAGGGNAKGDSSDDDDDAVIVAASSVKACGQLEQAFADLKTAFGN